MSSLNQLNFAGKSRDTSLRTITFFVTAIHAILLVVAVFQFNPRPSFKPKETFIVKTIQIGEKISTAPPSIAEAIPVSAPVEEWTADPEPEPQPQPEPSQTKAPQKKEESPEKVVVKAEPVKPAQVQKSKTLKKEDKPSRVKKKTSEVKKEKAPPVPAKKKETKSVVSQNAEATKAKQQALLRKAKESIAKIDKSHHNITSNDVSHISRSLTPGRIGKLEIEALSSTSGAKVNLSPREASYRDELVHRLKLLLRLPDYGEVKVQLTLKRSGSVSQVVIVKAESQPNQKYIEKMLPTLSFPHFGDNFPNQEQYTFLISLSNDI